MRIWCDSWWTEEEERAGAGEEHRVSTNHRRQTQAGSVWEIRNDRLLRRPFPAGVWSHGRCFWDCCGCLMLWWKGSAQPVQSPWSKAEASLAFISRPCWPDVRFPVKMCTNQTTLNKSSILCIIILKWLAECGKSSAQGSKTAVLFCPAGFGPVINRFQSYKVVSRLRRELWGLRSHIPVKAVCG